jgi:hypothetical protein
MLNVLILQCTKTDCSLCTSALFSPGPSESDIVQCLSGAEVCLCSDTMSLLLKTHVKLRVRT